MAAFNSNFMVQKKPLFRNYIFFNDITYKRFAVRYASLTSSNKSETRVWCFSF